MAASPTVPPKDETRHVVLEPLKPSQTRLKQYVTLSTLEINKTKYGSFQSVSLTEDGALPYLSAHRILPLDVALREGIYPPTTEKTTHKTTEKIKAVIEDVTGLDVTPETPPTETPKKSFLGNSLRDTIQTHKAKIDATKLAAIRSGGKK